MSKFKVGQRVEFFDNTRNGGGVVVDDTDEARCTVKLDSQYDFGWPDFACGEELYWLVEDKWVHTYTTPTILSPVDAPEMEQNASGATKHTGGKLDPSFIPICFSEALNKHMELVGPKGKYGRNNWPKGLKASQCLNAILRHTWALIRGEDIDVETGTHHIISIAANAMMYFGCLTFGRLADDRVEIYPDAFMAQLNKEEK